MIEHSGVEPLRRWLNRDMTPQTVGALVAHPGFAEAGRALNRGKVEAAAEPAMAALSRDAGHYVAAALVFSLHGEAGITLPRLKAACCQTRFISPGRARSMLGYLLHVGFLTRVSPRNGQTAAIYAMTPRFIAAWCGRMRHGLEAVARLEPAVRGLLDRMDDPEVALTFARHRGGTILAGLAAATGHDLPFVRIFNHRLGGGRAMALLLSRDAGEGMFATAQVPWSLDDIVKHCGISRVQARRLFDEALAEGLVSIADGRLTWLEPSRQFIVHACAFEFASLLISAAATVAALPEVFAVAEPA